MVAGYVYSRGRDRRTLYDLYSLYFLPEVVVMLTIGEEGVGTLYTKWHASKLVQSWTQFIAKALQDRATLKDDFSIINWLY